MPQLTYKIIGMQLSYDMTENVRVIVEEFDPEFWQETTPNNAKELACRIHLGYAPPNARTREILREGAEWVCRYLAKGDTRDIKGGWYHPLSRGMLLSLLIKDTEKLRSICSWAKPTKRPEYKGPLEDEIQLSILS